MIETKTDKKLSLVSHFHYAAFNVFTVFYFLLLISDKMRGRNTVMNECIFEINNNDMQMKIITFYQLFVYYIPNMPSRTYAI